MHEGVRPFVSIITLNYNQTEETCAFLESTRSLIYPNYEILVCDMASNEDPTETIRQRNYPHTRVIVSPRNLGFAAGNNWGMQQAKGDYYFIVNNDTVVTPYLIENLVAPFEKDPAIAVTCPKIKFYAKPNVIQYAGFDPMNVYTGRTRSIGEMEEDVGQYDYSGTTSAAHGCAMMVKKDVIRKVGRFAEKFFLYYEEWDWSARMRRAGYKIWYEGKAVIYHKESMTVGKHNPIKVYFHTRNRILYMRRNSSPFQLFIFSLVFAGFVVPKTILASFFRRDFRHLKLFLKGVAWNLRYSSRSPV
jgi:GT2 family glycosyltransferase